MRKENALKVMLNLWVDTKRYRMDFENDDVAPRIKFNRATYATRLVALLLALSSAITARADDQQRIADFLDNLNVHGYVIRPITDDYVGRTFPNFSFFGVIFRQYPVAYFCPGQQGPPVQPEQDGDAAGNASRQSPVPASAEQRADD